MANMTPSNSYIYFPEDNQETEEFLKEILPHMKNLIGNDKKFSVTLTILENVISTQELAKVIKEATQEARALEKRELIPHCTDKDGQMLFKLKR